MTATIITSVPGEIDSERISLREELELHRIAFLQLVDTLPDERWNDKSPTTAWTVREVLVHLTWALEQLPREIESARRGKGMFNYPKWMANPVSYWMTRWTARGATRVSIRSRYETGISNAIDSLDHVSSSELECRALLRRRLLHRRRSLSQSSEALCRSHRRDSAATSARSTNAMNVRLSQMNLCMDRRTLISRVALLTGLAALGLRPETATADEASPVASPDAEGQLITINGVDLFVVEHGDPNGRPLFMLHGGLGSSDNWSLVWPYLADAGFRVILPDSRSQGRSGWSPEPITYQLMADDVLGLMEHFGIADADIVGWSDGAIVGIQMAIEHRDKLGRVVAYGANASPEGLLPLSDDPAFEAILAQMAVEYQRLSPQPERFEELFAQLGALYGTEPNFSAVELQGITTPFLVMDGANEELG